MDDRTIHLINTISSYLQDIKIETSIIGFDNIEKHPEKLSLGICFSPVTKIASNSIRYIILLYPSFDRTISVVRETCNTLLSNNSPRKSALNTALSKDDVYLFIFSFMHEVGHILHIIQLGYNDSEFFDEQSGYYYTHNDICEDFADQFALIHTEKIYNILHNS